MGIKRELEFSYVGFLGERETGVPGENLLEGEDYQQTQPKYNTDSGNWTQVKLVGGERSHQCTDRIPYISFWLRVNARSIASCLPLRCPIYTNKANN